MAGVVGGQSTVQNVDLGCGDIPRHSQSLRSSANVMCAGEAHPAALMLAGVSCARNGTMGLVRDFRSGTPIFQKLGMMLPC